jgi:hypothetical protein
VGARNPDGPKKSDKPAKRRRRDASIHVRIAGEERRGQAALGDDELHFHTGRTGRTGKDFSLRVRYDEIKTLVADEAKGTLTVTTEETEVVLLLGRLAGDWKEQIENRPTIARLFGLTKRSRVAFSGVDDEELATILPAASADGELDAAFIGAGHRADLARVGELAPRLKTGGTLWVVVAPGGAVRKDLPTVARAAGLAEGATIELATGNEAVGFVKLA